MFALLVFYRLLKLCQLLCVVMCYGILNVCQLLCAYVCGSAVDCGSPPVVWNVSVSTPVGTTYLCDVTFTCLPGHFFHRDVFVKTITCQADGVWTDVKSCVRKVYLLTY